MAAKTIGDRISEARKAAGLSQSQLSEKCGWGSGQSRVSNYEQGRSFPSYEDLSKLGEAIGVNPAFLAFGPSSDRDGQGVSQGTEGSPIANSPANAMNAVNPLPGSDTTSTIRLDKELAPDANLAKCRWFRITDTSMQPLMPPGTAIFIDTSDTRIQSGKAYAVDIGGLIWVRWVYQLPRGEIRLAPENTAEWEDHTVGADEMEDFMILGRLVGYSVTI